RLVEASAAGKKLGEDFIGKMTASGGTNINDSLIAALKQFENNDRPKMLVFMTDGLPTVGESNVDKIVANIKTARKAEVRIFPFGFGYDVNTALLDKLGSENAGTTDYVQPKEDLEVKVSNFFAKVSFPVLTDVQIDFGPLKAENMYPRRFADLFKGTQLAILGRYTNSADLKAVDFSLRGKAGTDTRNFQYHGLAFPLRDAENDFLPRLWASRRVGWLIEQIRSNGETKEVKDEIIDLGTKYGIVTPYTS
ncbi:MAG TPA: trypsin, partial [Blastocatellia bacterium]|nr:trypsin [Blastocatellia bacterium]